MSPGQTRPRSSHPPLSRHMTFINKIALLFSAESGTITLIKTCPLWINCHLRGGEEDSEARGLLGTKRGWSHTGRPQPLGPLPRPRPTGRRWVTLTPLAWSPQDKPCRRTGPSDDFCSSIKPALPAARALSVEANAAPAAAPLQAYSRAPLSARGAPHHVFLLHPNICPGSSQPHAHFLNFTWIS